jgi:hypothetical protein
VRSEAIFRASETISNKFMLCGTVSRATRRLHISSKDMHETINLAFTKVGAIPDIALDSDPI